MNEIKVGNVVIKVNHKFENISDALQKDIFKFIKKWFTWKLDKYIEKKIDPKNLKWHLNIFIKHNSRNLYDWNFNFRLGNENVIYKREWFKNIVDLVNHFLDHVKEEFSKK